MRYTMVCALASTLFLVGGCSKDHVAAKQYIEKSDVGKTIYDYQFGAHSVFLTCEDGIVRFVDVFRDEYGAVTINSIQRLSPRVRCDLASTSDLGDSRK